MTKEDFKMRMQRQAVRSMAKAAGLELADRQPVQRADGYAYQLAVNDEQTEASINILGDICEWAFEEWGEMSAVLLSSKLQELPGTVSQINVRINSYGGSVKEGVAIYNMLRSHGANVTTYCIGMACSIASVIFMAGDERVMSHASQLMVHNAWSWAVGNAAELRKAADDLDKANDLSVAAYMSRVSIEEAELRGLMDAETWLMPDEALEYGFATAIDDYSDEEDGVDAMASARPKQAAKEDEDPDEEPETDEDPATDEDPDEEPEADEEPETDEDPDEEPEADEDEEDAQERAQSKWSAVLQALKAAQ